MTVLHFIFGNWALKLGAVVLAVIMYVGMVALQTTQVWTQAVTINPVNQPTGSFLIKPSTSQVVTEIHYIAAPDVPISRDSFQATIDLATVRVDPALSTVVRVSVTAQDPRIQILDFKPQEVSVTLDRVLQETVRVQVPPLTLPSGLSPGPQTLSASEVQAKGPSSAVSQVVSAQVTGIRVDPSGIDVNGDYNLVPVDKNGKTVDNVELDPSTVHVSIQIGSQLRTQTVAVNPTIKGSPAAGYYISSVDVNPSVVSVSGEADALASLSGQVNTQPISISGATGDVSVKVALNLPTGVEAPTVTTISVTVHLISPPSTRSVAVGIVPVGSRADRKYSFSTLSTIVTIGGASAALDAFDTSTLVATIDVSSLEPGTYTVQVTVVIPSGIKLVALSPGQITVTVSIPVSPVPSPT